MIAFPRQCYTRPPERIAQAEQSLRSACMAQLDRLKGESVFELKRLCVLCASFRTDLAANPGKGWCIEPNVLTFGTPRERENFFS